MKEQFQLEVTKLAIPLNRADKALTEVEAKELLDELKDKWDSGPVESVVNEIEPLDGDEAKEKRQSLDTLSESRRFWIDKLTHRLQLHAQFISQHDVVNNRLKQLTDEAAKLSPTPENIGSLQVSTSGFLPISLT